MPIAFWTLTRYPHPPVGVVEGHARSAASGVGPAEPGTGNGPNQAPALSSWDSYRDLVMAPPPLLLGALHLTASVPAAGPGDTVDTLDTPGTSHVSVTAPAGTEVPRAFAALSRNEHDVVPRQVATYLRLVAATLIAGAYAPPSVAISIL